MEPINHGKQIIRDYRNDRNDISAWAICGGDSCFNLVLWLLLPLATAISIAYLLVYVFGPAVMYY